MEWFAAPESDRVVEIERRGLAKGLQLIRDAHELADRADTAELLDTIVERTGYRLHLLLRDGAAEALANIERFFAMLEEYRHLSLGSFLGLWERWEEQDLGIPQAPLYSKEDDVVTLSTIHTAKGLEGGAAEAPAPDVSVLERPGARARLHADQGQAGP